MSSAFLIILLSLIFSAFFSGIEIAYYSSNKLRMELKRKQGAPAARLLSYFIRHPSHFMTNTLVGNNIALVVYGIFMKQVLESFFTGLPYAWLHNDFLTFIIITIISALIVLVFAEFLPKAFFRINPDRLLFIFSYPFVGFYYLFYPVNLFVIGLSKFILRKFLRVDLKEDKPVFNHYDLFHLVTESSEEPGDIDLNTQIFKNAIEFPYIKVRECMTPRPEIKATRMTASIKELKSLFEDTGYSKIVIYNRDIDNIVGYVHIGDMYKNPRSIESILMPITIATESMPASELLRLLIEKHRSIAIVVDEFGGTSGIITIEDIIEEIFGEIRDEHDVQQLIEKKVSENYYIFSARMEIDYLNEKYGLDLPEGDYETLGGLILSINENIPKTNEIVNYGKFQFTILSASISQIKEIGLKIIVPEDKSNP